METAEELRKRLKDARTNDDTERERNSSEHSSITTSSTSSDIERYSPDFTNQNGHSIQSVSGQSNGIVSTVRATRNAERKLANLVRSVAQIDHGERPGSRRSGENNGKDRSDGTNVPTGVSKRSTRQIGNLETDEEIPARSFTESDPQTETNAEKPETKGTEEPRKRGRPAKQRTIPFIQTNAETETKRKIPGWSSGNTLTKQEAKELEEPLIAALTTEFELLDKTLWGYTGDPLQQPIWSDITEKEMESLTHIVLKLGQKSTMVATAARVAVDGSDYVTAAVVIAPRFQSTVNIISKARKEHVQNKAKRSRFSRNRGSDQQTT